MLPIRQPKPALKRRAITDEEKKYSVFQALRVARANQRLAGVRAKKATQEGGGKGDAKEAESKDS